MLVRRVSAIRCSAPAPTRGRCRTSFRPPAAATNRFPPACPVAAELLADRRNRLVPARQEKAVPAVPRAASSLSIDPSSLRTMPGSFGSASMQVPQAHGAVLAIASALRCRIVCRPFGQACRSNCCARHALAVDATNAEIVGQKVVWRRGYRVPGSPAVGARSPLTPKMTIRQGSRCFCFACVTVMCLCL